MKAFCNLFTGNGTRPVHELLIALVLILSILPGLNFGQVPEDKAPEYVFLVLQNGTELKGRLLRQENDSISLEVEGVGLLSVAMSNVRSMRKMPYRSYGGSEFFYHNLQATRYFFSPNGFGLKKGEAYYQNTWIFINQASYGFSDNFTLGVGVVPLFLFAGAPSPVWITPKLSFPVREDVLNIGVGGLFGTVLGFEEATFGIGYGSLTLGDRDRNLNLAVGYGMAGGEWSSVPNITLSGMLRLGRKFYLLSENYFVPDAEVALFSIGGRSFLERASIDYGLVIPSGTGVFVGIPWLGFTIPFVPGR